MALFKRPTSAEREALARANEDNRTRRERVAAIETALATARNGLWTAKATLKAATAAIQAAKANAAQHLVSVASGQSEVPPITIKAARAALIDAQDDLEVAEATIAALEAELCDATNALNGSGSRTVFATLDLLRASPEIPALLEEVARLQIELANKGQALLWAADKKLIAGVVGGMMPNGEWRPPSKARAVLDMLLSPPLMWKGLIDPGHGAAEWEAVLTALQSDASAPLPVIQPFA